MKCSGSGHCFPNDRTNDVNDCEICSRMEGIDKISQPWTRIQFLHAAQIIDYSGGLTTDSLRSATQAWGGPSGATPGTPTRYGDAVGYSRSDSLAVGRMPV